MRRVVITGLGLVTPLGSSASSTFTRLLNSEVGLRLHEKSEGLPVKVGGLLPDDLVISDHMKKLSIVKNFYNALSLLVASDAAADANISETDPEEKGIIFGSDRSSTTDLFEAHSKVIKGGYVQLDRFIIPKVLPSQAIGTIGMKLKMKGHAASVSAGLCTGAVAIRDAFRCIRRNDAQVMIAGASEVEFDRALQMSLYKNGVHSRSNVPETACLPFSENRDGIAYSVGAGAVVLEELEHALKRNANIYAEVVGTSAVSDTQNFANGMERAMKRALKDLTPDLIVADAPGFRNIDTSEAQSILNVAPNASVTAVKRNIGHTLSASGAIQAVVAALAIKTGQAPPMFDLVKCVEPKLNIVKETKKADFNVALANTFCLDGTCFSSLVLNKFN